MTFPDWWKPGVEVVNSEGRRGEILQTSQGWFIQMLVAKDQYTYVANPDPAGWERLAPEVETRLDSAQLDRVVYDAEHALLRAFGIHYVPAWEALPEVQRAGKQPRPKVVGRSDLDGLRRVLREVVRLGLSEYVEN